PNLPIAVNTLATLRRNTGDFEGARQLYERDIDLWQAIGGADPPGVSVDLNDYAEMLLGRGDLEGARPRFERALAIREKRLGAERAAGMAAQIWDELVRSRGMVLDEMALRHRTATSGEHSRAAAPARELEQARNRLARVVVEGPEGADPGEYAARLVRAREEKESAERALAAVSAAFRRE